MARKIPEIITQEELIKILKKVENKRDYTAYAISFYGCMRISEIVKLKKDNIDFGQRLIRIKQAKGKKDRNIPIPPEVKVLLKNIPLDFKGKDKGIRALQISFKRYAREVLNKDLHFHCLRHSGATHYLNKKNWDITQLQVLLGHAKVSTTEIYTHISPKSLIEKMYNEK